MTDLPYRAPDLSSSVLIHFTDGTVTDIGGLADAARGRHIDQVTKIELFPSVGGRLDGARGTRRIRGESLTMLDLPFPVNVIWPLEVAQKIGADLSAPDQSAPDIWTPS